MVDGGQGEEGRALGAGGRYLIQGLLGEGGMASVHRAYDTVLDRNVAIKTMHSEFSREQSFRERFRREAQAVARLNHTNIVAVYDSGEDDSGEGAPIPFIVMEYVEGRPLRDVLNEDIEHYGAMPTEKALDITADVLAALGVSHEMNLVHRDIKPGNVMLTRRNVVKVMDFGIARAMQSGVTSMTQTGMVVGTPQYLSPEQALGRGVDHRSDLYTTGVMLFELLTGQLPFDADSPLSIAYHHVQTPPPVPSSINQAIPPAVDAFVARALAKDPADRFPSADAMRDEARRINAPETRGGNTPLVTGGAPVPGQAPNSGQQVFSPVAPGGNPPTPQPGYGYPQQGGFGAPNYQTPAPQYPAPGVNPYQGGVPAQQPGPVPPPGGYGAPPAAGGEPAAGGNGGRAAGRRRGKKGPIIAIVAAVVVASLATLPFVDFDEDGKPGKPQVGPSHQRSHDTAKPSPSKAHFQGPVDPKGGYKDSDFESCDNVYPDQDGKITVPNFSYQSIKWSKECAKRPAVGLKIKVERSKSTVWRKGTVMSQSPDSQKPVKKGSTVTLTVSSGP